MTNTQIGPIVVAEPEADHASCQTRESGIATLDGVGVTVYWCLDHFTACKSEPYPVDARRRIGGES